MQENAGVSGSIAVEQLRSDSMPQILYVTLASALAVTSAPGLAQTAQQPAPASASASASSAKAKDPNEWVCVTEEITGSRLASHRVCSTRAEFAARRLADQQFVDRLQNTMGSPPPR